MIAVAPPAAAAPATIRFAPPVGEVLRYETIERRPDGAGERSFRMEHEVRFTRDRDGYRMEARLAAAAADAPPEVARRYDAAMRPFLGVAVTLALAADGSPRGLVDADASWAKVVASLRAYADALAAEPDFPPERLAAARAVVARYEAMPAAERAAALSGWLLDLLAPPDLPLRTGERAPYHAAGNGADGGMLRLDGSDTESARFAIEATTDGATLDSEAEQAGAALGYGAAAAGEARAAAAAGLIQRGSLAIARASGLLRDMTVETRLGAGANAPLLSTRIVRHLP